MSAVVGTCRVAVVPGLTVVYGPSMDGIREGLFQIGDDGSANANFDELPLVDKKFEVVPPALAENLGAHGSFKTIALSRFGFEAFRI